MKIINVDINDEIIFKNVLDVDTGVITGISSSVKLPTGNYNNIILNFSFANQKLCEKFHIFANFKINNNTPIVQELVPMEIGDVSYTHTCYIPNEVFQEKCEVALGVYGYRLNEDETLAKRFSLVPVRNFVIEGSYNPDSTESIVPTPTVFEIYFDKINKAEADIQNMLEQGNSDISTMLNQCEEDYNTFKAEKDAEVNDFLNNAEGQFMGTVQQLETDFAETQTLVNQMETKVDEMEATVGEMETTVGEMESDIVELYGMDNYELLSLEQEDISEVLEVDVHAQISSDGYAVSGKSEWTGEVVGKSNTENLDFSISSTNELYLKSSGTQTQYTRIFKMTSDGVVETLSGVNDILSRSEFVNDTYYLAVRSHTTSTTYFTWDLGEACTPTLNYRFSQADNPTFDSPISIEGSNDKSEWIHLSKLSITGLDNTYTPTTAYRYFRINFQCTKTSGSVTSTQYSTKYVYYLYFSNIPEMTAKFKNNFISKNNFEIKETANVIVPSIPNYEYVTEENINGLPIAFKLRENSRYKLRYDGETLVTDEGAKVVTGTYTGTGTYGTNNPTEIECGFTPKVVIIVPRTSGDISLTILINNFGNTSYPSTGVTAYNSQVRYVTAYFTSTGVSFSSIDSDEHQSNKNTWKYIWTAIG